MDFIKNTGKYIQSILQRLFYTFGNRRNNESRPWGYYRIIEERRGYKIKEICVFPGHRLSYQRHLIRSERWCILSGNALVTLEAKEELLKEGDAIYIPKSSWHRVENCGKSDLIFIELQLGSYLGEDDIERSSDDYGRA